MPESSILNELTSIVGGENAVQDPHVLESSAVDGVIPKIVLFPENIEQISGIMKTASRAGASVAPTGSGTKRGIGNKPIGADIVLSTRKLDRVIAHESSDLVATTECGIALSDLQSYLGRKNQFLPVDPPHVRGGATVGGIIATNDSGPLRLRYGTSRELLIGMKVVRADGGIFKGGSKVVKNVAGYDMPKLFVGSLGTLGIIAEATFRLYPVPESSKTYIACFESMGEAHDTVRSLINSNLVLNALEHMNPGLAGSITERLGLGSDFNRYTLAVRIMNVLRAVEDQIKTVSGISQRNNGKGLIIEARNEEAFWHEVREFPWRRSEQAGAVLKAGVLISDVPRVFILLDELSDKYGIRARAAARAGNGIVIISIDGDSESVVSSVNALRQFSEYAGGSLVVREASPDIKPVLDVWGGMGSSLGLMKRIKSAFDPGNILNPGRLF
ncbi:MAG TPA: FAD-binding oxidoreductase [Thermodesulfobacteriota bacterium]|nr:FAD-binding oxidoreductase [Thermodesulfobacteriota bacterium]